MNDGRNLTRAVWSLEGLSVGDAFGDSLFFSRRDFDSDQRVLPSARWEYTDDTQMAFSVFETLRKFGVIDQGHLAKSFAEHFERNRGYGMAMYELLPVLRAENWQRLAQSLFGGQGSYGNGGAMRVAPLGAFLADDLDMVVENARLSAEVTHAHPEGVAGAIAVAVAAAWAARLKDASVLPGHKEFLERVASFVPPSLVHDKILSACPLSHDLSIWEVIRVLGNGSGISAQDTVPFTL